MPFRLAPTIETDLPTSTDYNGLADAYRDKILGIDGFAPGDCAWRIAWSAASATQLIRNPDGLAFPPEDEFLKLYANRPNTATDTPSTGLEPIPPHGEPQGWNVQNTLIQFVFGIAPRLDSEAERLHGLGKVEIGGVLTPKQKWEQAKRQAGFTTGGLWTEGSVISAPALVAARQHLRIFPRYTAKSNVNYGGFFPSPEIAGFCTQVGDEEPQPIYTITFTYIGTDPALSGATKLYYLGCSANDPVLPSFQPHLAGLFYGPLDYLLEFFDHTTTRLNRDEWLIGPFTGAGVLNHSPGTMLNHGIQHYSMDHRGALLDRVEHNYAEKYSWDNHKFFAEQYLLAPIRGVDSGGVAVEDKVFFSFTGSVTVGQKAVCNKGGANYVVPAGFALTAFFVESAGLDGPASLEVTIGTQTFPISTHNSETIRVIPAINAPANAIEVIAVNSFTVGTSLTIEIRESLQYKPFPHDQYLVMRSAFAQSSAQDTPEGLPEDVSDPKRTGNSYFTSGCIITRNDTAGIQPPPDDKPYLNAVYEMIRRFVHDHVRMAHRTMIKGYEVVDGKSVIYCLKDALTSEYEVFDGMIDAITDTAATTGRTNEWVCFFSWMPNDKSELMDAESYADILGHLNNPAHLFSTELRRVDDPATDDLGRHFALGREGRPQDDFVESFLVTKAPSGYSYAKGTNNPASGNLSDAEAIGFFKSNPIYKAPYEIDSVEPFGADQVKITLKGRLQAHDNAPGAIANAPGGWDFDALAGQSSGTEDYATDENRLRKYIYKFVAGFAVTWPHVIGDMSVTQWPFRNSAVNVPQEGTIMPRLHFVRLPRKVHEDANNIPEFNVDTLIRADEYLTLSWYSTAMCEGFIDAQATVNDCVNAVQLYDYTFEECCRQAFGGRAFEIMPQADRDFDRAHGQGPFPAVRIKKGTFNQFSAFVNLLDRVRLDAPIEIERQISISRGHVRITPLYSSGAPGACTVACARPAFSGWVVWQGQPPNTEGTPCGGFFSQGDWEDWDGDWESVRRQQGIEAFLECDGAVLHFMAGEQLQTLRWRFAAVQNVRHAFPKGLADLVDTNAGIFIQTITNTEEHHEYTAPGSGPTVGNQPINNWPGTGDAATIEIEETGQSFSSCAFFISGGIVTPASIGSNVLARWDTGAVIAFAETSARPANGLIGNGNLFVSLPHV